MNLRRLLFTLLAAALLPMTASAQNQMSSNDQSSVTINLVAKNIAFDTSHISVPAGAKVTINFDNKDSGIRHNFAVYETSSANNTVFKGKVITGANTISYTFTAPDKPGDYFFRCDIHPSLMTGTFTVTPAGSSSSNSGDPKSVTINLTAKNIAFDTSKITVPAGANVTVNFKNQDSGIRHNFAVYQSSSANNTIFKGQVITGVNQITYTFTAPSNPGNYFFRCDIHPGIMTGTFVVQ